MRVRIKAKRGYATREMKTCEHCGHTAPAMHPFGSVADFPDALAIKLIGVGIAEPAPKPIETAAAAPPENAAKRVSKPKSKASKSSRPATEEAE